MTVVVVVVTAAAAGGRSARAGQRPPEAWTLARHRCHQLDPTAAAMTKAAQRPLLPLPAPPLLADLLCLPAPLPWCQVLVNLELTSWQHTDPWQPASVPLPAPHMYTNTR
eukprot:COSAG01_NODE_35659_length_528_cov_3.268065_1_plen_109_part_01